MALYPWEMFWSLEPKNAEKTLFSEVLLYAVALPFPLI